MDCAQINKEGDEAEAFSYFTMQSNTSSMHKHSNILYCI